MTPESEYLLHIAREVADAYITLPNAKAAMVFGSVAQGVSDPYSDIDMGIYYETLPPEADLISVLGTLSDDGLRWRLGSHDAGVLILAFPKNGVECQVVHATLARIETDMTTVLTAEQVKTPQQKMLSGILDGIPLHDTGVLSVWKERAAAYPEALAGAMVRQNLTFFPIWAIYPSLASRDCTPWLYQTITENVFNILGVLSGINRLYYADFQLKRTGKHIAKMRIRPMDLAARIESLYRTEPAAAVAVLCDLVKETIAIVEAEMPDIDTAAARKTLDRTHEPWSLPSDASG